MAMALTRGAAQIFHFRWKCICLEHTQILSALHGRALWLAF
jgi:hypothetical protein